MMFGSNFDPFNQQPKGPFKGPLAGRPTGKQKESTQTGKILRFMFNPELGEDLKSMRGQHSHFLKLIANLFLQTGLIDASYIGFIDPNQMGLVSLIQEAHKNLRYTREGLPQLLLFWAFVGSLIVVGLSVVFFILAVGSSPAPPPTK